MGWENGLHFLRVPVAGVAEAEVDDNHLQMDEEHDPELYRLRMRAEVGAESPLWTEQGDLAFVDMLPIDAELQEALGVWADQVWDNLQGPSAEWRDAGKALHLRLVQELGPDYSVVLDAEIARDSPTP